jgi:N4-gp56 family major capsid protein
VALTNFGALLTEQKTVWARDLWKQARNVSFINKFAAGGINSMVTRITELTKSEKGTRAVMTLVADLEGDGVVGDNELEGNEEGIRAYDEVITIDQLRHGNRNKGRMADQATIVKFRETSRDVLAYWLADRIDQLAFLTLSGVSYAYKTNGVARSGTSQLSSLDFAADVTAPSTNRYLVWDATGFGVNAANTSLVAADTPTYGMLVAAKAIAKERMIRGVRSTKDGEEYYHVFMTPTGLSKLKLDSDYLANLRNAGARGYDNPLFSGGQVTQDGLVIHEFRHVYHASTWGSGAVAGQRVLLCGAQALGLADLGAPEWDEETYDYGNSQGIAISKILGMLKPRFYSNVHSAVEDFGVLAIDTAI